MRAVSSVTTWRAICPRGVKLLLAIVARGVLLLTQGGVRPLPSDSPWPPLPPLKYISMPSSPLQQSILSSSTLPYLLLLQVMSLPCRRYFHYRQLSYCLLTRALGTILHHRFRQQVSGMRSPRQKSSLALQNQPESACGSTLRRHSSKITAFIPWIGFPEVCLYFKRGRAPGIHLHINIKKRLDPFGIFLKHHTHINQ